MRSNIKKMRIKKVSKKAPEWKQQRLKDQSWRVTILNRSFDLAETDDEAIALHQGRRYP
jgi:predicted ribosome-associated RNA-binding protein Tma20|tara:strand:- start:2 stop:178 length:177 start_codon:yes stop_codon:yes gene_type:complete